MTTTPATSPSFAGARWILLLLALLAAAACIAGIATGHHRAFFRAYLFAWLFFLSLPLGGLCLVMLHNLTGGHWADAPRILARAAALTLPLLAILFIPIVLGMHDLFLWTNHDQLAANHILQHRASYLNIPFFIARAVLYFIIWIVLAWLLTSWQKRWQKTAAPNLVYRLRRLSAAGLIIYLMTMTHASIDWVISRDVEFYSTAFGLIVTVGQTLSAMAFCVVLLSLAPIRRAIGESSPSAEIAPIPRGILNDMGNILLVLVILWIYVSFMQFLVIWMGNSREDNTWYVQRGLSQPGPWRWVAGALILFHFFIPFYMLLFRAAKQRRTVLTAIAWMLLLAHIIEIFWFIAPSGPQGGPDFTISWLDPAAFLAVGALWLALFLWILERRPAAPDELPMVLVPAPHGASA